MKRREWTEMSYGSADIKIGSPQPRSNLKPLYLKQSYPALKSETFRHAGSRALVTTKVTYHQYLPLVHIPEHFIFLISAILPQPRFRPFIIVCLTLIPYGHRRRHRLIFTPISPHIIPKQHRCNPGGGSLRRQNGDLGRNIPRCIPRLESLRANDIPHAKTPRNEGDRNHPLRLSGNIRRCPLIYNDQCGGNSVDKINARELCGAVVGRE